VRAERFQLYKRAKHVFAEALRVLEFRDVCLRAAEPGDAGEGTLRALGALMDASQTSCAALFECSHPRLDELTALARRAGAYGARLTGAGWGGCVVALVAEDQVRLRARRQRSGVRAEETTGGRVHREDQGRLRAIR
jgi:galactokinase